MSVQMLIMFEVLWIFMEVKNLSLSPITCFTLTRKHKMTKRKLTVLSRLTKKKWKLTHFYFFFKCSNTNSPKSIKIPIIRMYQCINERMQQPVFKV